MAFNAQVTVCTKADLLLILRPSSSCISYRRLGNPSKISLQSLNQFGDMPSQSFASPLAAQIRRDDTWTSLFQRNLDRLHHLVCRLLVSIMLKHHLTSPNRTNRVGNTLSIDVGRRSMNRLEQGGEFAFWIDVARGGNTDRPGASRSQVGENVTKEVLFIRYGRLAAVVHLLIPQQHQRLLDEERRMRSGYQCDTCRLLRPGISAASP